MKTTLKTVKGRQLAQTDMPAVYSLKDVATGQKKVMIFGPMGSGKTMFVVGCLLAGEVIFVLSTDFGGQGLSTVAEELKRLGREDLMDNLRGITLNDYEQVEKFLLAPEEVMGDFVPTVEVWDGFSAYQLICLYARGKEKFPSAEQNFPFWGEVQTATLSQLGKFLALQTPDGKVPHKIVTCLEDKPETDEFSKRIQTGPLLHTKAKSLSGGGFDLIIHCFVEEEEGKGLKYMYRTAGDSNKFATKSRGIKFDTAKFEAQPEVVWKKIVGRE